MAQGLIGLSPRALELLAISVAASMRVVLAAND